jgi:hypothetical protein
MIIIIISVQWYEISNKFWKVFFFSFFFSFWFQLNSDVTSDSHHPKQEF